jgi:hypothetical protein
VGQENIPVGVAVDGLTHSQGMSGDLNERWRLLGERLGLDAEGFVLHRRSTDIRAPGHSLLRGK